MPCTLSIKTAILQKSEGSSHLRHLEKLSLPHFKDFPEKDAEPDPRQN